MEARERDRKRMMSINSVISMIVRASLEFGRKSNNESKVWPGANKLCKRLRLQGESTVVQSGEPRDPAIKVTASHSQ